jgi:hypothetical protein
MSSEVRWEYSTTEYDWQSSDWKNWAEKLKLKNVEF